MSFMNRGSCKLGAGLAVSRSKFTPLGTTINSRCPHGEGSLRPKQSTLDVFLRQFFEILTDGPGGARGKIDGSQY